MSALEQIELEDSGRYRYVQTVRSEDGDWRKAQFDPMREPQWQLISMNGIEPTEKERKTYQKDKRKEAERRRDEQRLKDMLVPGSLTVIDETPQEVTLQFTPQLDDIPEKALPFINGQVIWDLQADRLSTVTISSTGAFSPALSVKVENMRMHFEFAALDDQTIPQNIQFTFQGKFAGLKRFDVDSIVEFSDVQRVPSF